MAPSFVTKALRKIELPQEEEASRWINEDIRPVPPARQTWGTSAICEEAHQPPHLPVALCN